MPDEEYIIAGTGSRELQNASAEVKKAVVEKLKIILGYEKSQHGDNLVVMSGMAEGFDKALAVVALALNIKLWVAIPNKAYGPFYWGRKSYTGTNRMAEFNSIIERATYITYVMEDVHKVTGDSWKWKGRFSMNWRNDFMVDNADYFLVWDPRTKGTASCLASIKKAKVPYEEVKI